MGQKVFLLKNKTDQGDKYESVFEKNGFSPVFLPLIKHTNEPAAVLTLFNDLEYLKRLEVLIVTSQRTVECLSASVVPVLSDEQRQLLFNKTVYSVGSATSAFLERIGFRNVRGGEKAGNGSLLADIIKDELPNHSSESILFLVGEIRKDIIPKKLRNYGIAIEELVVYKTCDLDDNLTRFKEVYVEDSWVVVFSPQGTEEILQFVKSQLNGSCHIASIGPTTEQFLHRMGIIPEIVSPKPEANSLVNEMLSI